MQNIKYKRILDCLCNYYRITEYEYANELKEKDNRYLLLLLLKNCNCLDIKEVKKLLELRDSRSIINNINRAEEKLLMNKIFRENYFELEDIIINK